MGSITGRQNNRGKVDGHSLLETLIAITIISIVLTIATMSYNNVISASVNFSETINSIESQNEVLNCIYNENCNTEIKMSIERKTDISFED